MTYKNLAKYSINKMQVMLICSDVENQDIFDFDGGLEWWNLLLLINII